MELQDILKFIVSVMAGLSISRILYRNVDQDLILIDVNNN